jgi:hypothetical protein
MSNDTKNIMQTPKQKLINKVKETAYDFDKTKFKKFQDFFSSEFSNINLEEVRKHAWRTR